MKNSMMDVHNHLLARLEELGDETKGAEEMESAIKRADSSCRVAAAIAGNARLVLDAQKFMAEQGVAIEGDAIPMLASPKVNGG